MVALLSADQLNGASRLAGQDDPVIATVDRHHLTKPHFSELVVDADQPRPAWRSGIMLIITLEARPERPWSCIGCGRSWTSGSLRDGPASG